MKTSITSNLQRARLLASAKAIGSEKLAEEEHALASEIVRPEILALDPKVRRAASSAYQQLTAFQATQAFAERLTERLARFASAVGAKQPEGAKYDLRFATPVMFRGVWQARQIADELGMSYASFIDAALGYWEDQGRRRIPRVTQLCAPEVLRHVLSSCIEDASNPA